LLTPVPPLAAPSPVMPTSDHQQQRPPRSNPPIAPFSTGSARPDRPFPPQHAPSSKSDSSSRSDSTSDIPIPHLAYPQHGRVQFEQALESNDGSRANLIPVHSNDGNAYASSSSTTALPPGAAASSYSNAAPFQRKKSLVRPERERVDENSRLYNYRNHAAAMEQEGRGVLGISRTGHYATTGLAPEGVMAPNSAFNDSTNLRRGKSILAREEGMANETGLSMFKRGATLRRPNNRRSNSATTTRMPGGAWEKSQHAKTVKTPLGPWMIWCLIVTACFPAPLLKCFGYKTKDRQTAWREKMGLLTVIGISMAAVGFLTFGFTKSVCGTPQTRYRTGNIGTGSMIFHGSAYDLNNFSHPAAAGIAGGSNPLYNAFDAGGKDGSFLFQDVNNHCLDVITPATGSDIPVTGQKLGWYFPCNLYNQWGSSAVNKTGYSEGVLCHTQTDARSEFSALKKLGQVYFTWSDLKNSSRNLGVYDGNVLDFSLLQWLDSSQVTYPALFDEIKTGNASYMGRDITALMEATSQRAVAKCMVDVIRVGYIDSVAIGCVASDIVLYVSLAVIIGVVVLRFFMAVLFGWFLSWKIGKFPNETYAQRMARSAEIENWTDDIYRPAPARYRPTVKPTKKIIGLPKTSRFSKADLLKVGASTPSLSSSATRVDFKLGDHRKSASSNALYSSGKVLGAGMRNSPPGSPGGGYRGSRSSTSLPISSFNFDGSHNPTTSRGMMGACPFPLNDVVPQPPADYEPFNYPLAHTILLVTAYSESVEGLRTTLDSLATTDYPNSHKVILVIADGMVKGSGNSLTTPEIALSMMKELVVSSEDVESLSYVAIADGHKRHNRAKVYAGFYDYDNNTVEGSKQQRVPMMLIAKVGNPAEARDAKPGNRGKRDSQIVLMAFLQKVMFDERMSALEYEFFNSLWRCTGVSPDRYETVLCVDADTKVFPDSVSRMVSCMVHDPEIMGLCGETKIANKAETWVTMIQVFEYYVSHHLTKAFESMFGGVTCLPGCFSMYRIKSPKGGEGYWVPILANPDIVSHYSENVVDTLHKKNLLLLGEDRYLTTLMLTTFPRRKMMFCPQAVCKTVVPDTFGVLLSQRRRWINSTVHNLFELFVVPDLCGVFCFSMRFVVFMELAGTLVLPAAIAFTLYLIVVAIIPGTVKPVVSLILLALILGIPALLIVVTSRKIAYLGWMLIYLMSLPIWNFVLPFYAFLHMDDFSWGQTRKIVGDTGGGHTDKDGEFDSSNIVMKRWADFERDRRYRSGNHSRDSTYDNLILQRSGSPQRTASNRYSVVSSAETYTSAAGGSGATHDALFRGSPQPPLPTDGLHSGPRRPQTLELPAPLASQGSHSPPDSVESSPLESSPELPPKRYENHSDARHQASSSGLEYPRYPETGYDSDEIEREGILGRESPVAINEATFPSRAYTRDSPYTSEPEVISHPGRSLVQAPESSRSESVSSRNSNPFGSSAQVHRRGVSLVDAGPVPGQQGFRTVQRSRRTSQGPGAATSTAPSSSRSRNSLAAHSDLPTLIGSPPASSDSFSPTSSLPSGASHRLP
ncbi:chitin synthase, partial [Phenoliferia sp. Uapishka_3]